MFAVKCDELGREVLLTNGAISGIANHDGKVLVEYRCWCGERGLLVTGKGVAERSGHAVTA